MTVPLCSRADQADDTHTHTYTELYRGRSTLCRSEVASFEEMLYVFMAVETLLSRSCAIAEKEFRRICCFFFVFLFFKMQIRIDTISGIIAMLK